MTQDQIKEFILGEWTSIAPEVRPSATKDVNGNLKPFYLTRVFTYSENDTFDLTVKSFADSNGKVPLAEMFIRGHVTWKGDHPVASGAQKVDFVADIEYAVKPLHAGFADTMNQLTKGFNPWKVNEAQSILRKAFLPFGLAEGQVFAECDLMYVFNDLLFWGARHVDGRGFDKEENRPTNLQIPMVRSGKR